MSVLKGARYRGNVVQYLFWCPACEEPHAATVARWEGRDGPVWNFDGNLEVPTFAPSFRVSTVRGDGQQRTKCHFFIRSGRIEYCSDSPHSLSGQTVPMVDWDSDERLRSWGFSGGDE